MHDQAPVDGLRPGAGPLRLARSAAAALTRTVAAFAGHAWADGRLPAGPVVGVLLGAWAVTWCLAGRRLTGGQLVGVLMLGQVVAHCSASGSMGVAMLLGHLVAVGTSLAVLTRGEAFLWHLAERLGLRAATVLAGRPPVPAVDLPDADVHARPHHGTALACSRVVRGPPVAAC